MFESCMIQRNETLELKFTFLTWKIDQNIFSLEIQMFFILNEQLSQNKK